MTEKLPRDMTENEVRYHCAALYDDIERLTAENERLVAALTEACDIALGTELTRQAVERINELRTAYQQIRPQPDIDGEK